MVEIAWPTGTTGKYAKVDLGTVNGFYKGAVRSFGTSYVREVSDREYGLVAPTGGPIQLVDVDFEVADILASTGSDLFGTEVTVRLALRMQNGNWVAYADWPVIFTGIVTHPEEIEPLVWQLTLQFDDRVLDSDIPAVLNRYDSSSATAITPQITYGKHISTGITDSGMLGPLPMIDPAAPDFLASLGTILILREFVGGVDYTPASESVEYHRPNGRIYTVIEGNELDPPITGDQSPLTIDCNGLYTSPISIAGGVITDPTEQIQHFLDNFVWGNYGSEDAWLTGQAPLNSTYLAESETFLDDRGYLGSRRIPNSPNAQIRARNVLEEWGQNFGVHMFWTGAGELALRVFDDTTTSIYIDDLWLKWNENEVGRAPRLTYDTAGIARNVRVKYVHIESRNEFAFALEVTDRFVTVGASASLDLYWMQSSL